LPYFCQLILVSNPIAMLNRQAMGKPFPWLFAEQNPVPTPFLSIFYSVTPKG